MSCVPNRYKFLYQKLVPVLYMLKVMYVYVVHTMLVTCAEIEKRSFDTPEIQAFQSV